LRFRLVFMEDKATMNTYIRQRLKSDAKHLVDQAAGQELIVHKGLRGRFRELLVDSILSPWLPPYAGCATGMIVDLEDRVREATQEDVVIFDRSIVPSVLAHASAMEGVFPMDGVLARVEVKTTLTKAELRNAVLAAKEIYEMKFCGLPGHMWTLPINTIFAYKSDLLGDPIKELERLLSVVNECGLHYGGASSQVPGPISALCVVGRGCWAFGGRHGVEPVWLQAKVVEPHDEILYFVGALSNSCFTVHADRQGLPADARRAGGGIGNFILSHESDERAAIQLPPFPGA
jgi:hypothetical protein